MTEPGHMTAILDVTTALELHRIMLKIRRVEEHVARIYPSDQIQSPVHLSIGQEAVSAGVCMALGKTDRIYGTYRGHGLFIARGGDLKRMFAELYGKGAGCARGRGGSMHLVAPEVGLMGCSAIVGSAIPVATGDALASEMLGRPRVVVAFFGDGAMDEGIFFESMNFAALKGLPIIYVCENNTLAIHSRVSDRHKQTELFRYGEALGVPGCRYDGNDVHLVYTTMVMVLEKIRNRGGPVLLEYMTYRWYEHVGPGIDHEESYRNSQEASVAYQNDPLLKSEKRLREDYQIGDEVFTGLEQSILKDIEEATRFAEESPFPSGDDLCTVLYEGER
jgi:TPP-dependent pyruvate/acetoin dehydrogenase alpha subunit